MQSPILWIVLVAVAIAVALVVVKNRDRSAWGFKDVVKDPGYWDEVSRDRARVAAEAEAAQQWDEAKVAALTKKYVLEATSSRDAYDETQILRALGEKTHPAVLSLLRDASLY